MPRVALVNMPFASPRWPSLGISLLKASLAAEGISCDVAYLNLDFAEQIGLEDYLWVADSFGFVLGGERLFAKYFFGEEKLPDNERYYRDVLLRADPELAADQWLEYLSIERRVRPFLEHVLASRDWGQYDIVGFTSSFQQTLSSLCLARRIKEIRPDVNIMFGGAACESEMGVEILRLFPQVDYVFLGEADATFPAVVRQILGGGPVQLPAGVASRASVSQSTIKAISPATEVGDIEQNELCNLDDLPYPDFDDYFDRLRRSSLADRLDPLFFFETSRGCWWGRKHHCSFCGLNGRCMSYRSKSPQRIIDELRFLADRCRIRRACAADNIFDPRYYVTLLPLMKKVQLEVDFIFEMRAAVNRAQIEQLNAAGMTGVQLGIETLSTPLLKLINKGTTAIQNLQSLKWFSEAGFVVEWNLLYGFPGEYPGEYKALAEILPSLYHLTPPRGFGRVRSDRFSPYFQQPGQHGITNLRPAVAFKYAFPFTSDALARLAYYFDYDYTDGRQVESYVGPLRERVIQWREVAGSAKLSMVDRDDGVLLIHDTRPHATVFQHRLTGIARLVYLFCDTGRTMETILGYAAQSGAAAVGEQDIRRILQGWIDARIAIFVDDRYLSLALKPARVGDATDELHQKA